MTAGLQASADALKRDRRLSNAYGSWASATSPMVRRSCTAIFPGQLAPRRSTTADGAIAVIDPEFCFRGCGG